LTVTLDDNGYLVDLTLWSESVAIQLARADGVDLNPSHWAVLSVLRDFYADTQVSPAMRPFVRLVREHLGSELGSSIALMTLFGDSPAKTAAKWAGLPRPTHCL